MVEQRATHKSKQIAILGWGSLLWGVENNRDFERLHGPWMSDGPELQLEFSRKSRTRAGALTLVIDPKHGAASRVAYAFSARAEPQEAINDLLRREGTTSENIGRFFAEHFTLNRARSAVALASIGTWAKEKSLDAVLWTDLVGDFDAIDEDAFVQSAVRYIQGLTAKGKAKAAEYVWLAPDFVRTPLRDALEKEPWFIEASG